MFTPPVDSVLQQVFRVRALIDGTMTVYVNDTSSFDKTLYPTNEEAIDELLDKDMEYISHHWPNMSFTSPTTESMSGPCYTLSSE